LIAISRYMHAVTIMPMTFRLTGVNFAQGNGIDQPTPIEELI